MSKPNRRATARGSVNASLWLVVLGVVLAISAYSLYFVARHLGVPRLFAVGMSTAFDGTALIMANQSLARAKAGMASFGPQAGMLLFAGVSAWLNSLHAVVGHETLLAIPLWAGLPVAAVMLFEFHTSFERRKAMAAHGRIYPALMPKLGIAPWVASLWATFFKMRDLVLKRRDAVIDHAIQRSASVPLPEAIPGVTVTETLPGSVSDGSASGGSVSWQSDTEALPDAEALPRSNTAKRYQRSVSVTLHPVRECASPTCSNSFTPSRQDQRYCGTRCRTAATRARAKGA